MSRSIAVSVERIVAQGPAGFIASRILEGPLRKGDVFTHCGDEVVELRIEKLVTFRMEFDELEGGDTAEITLSGEGFEKLKMGLQLTGVAHD